MTKATTRHCLSKRHGLIVQDFKNHNNSDADITIF